jgi:hypothetical protein
MAARRERLCSPPPQTISKSKGPMRFQAVECGKADLVQRKKVRKFVRNVNHRNATESASAEKPSARTEPIKVKLPKSAIVARPAEELGKDRAPPKRQEAPEPDLKVEAKPRKTRAKGETPKSEAKEKPNSESKDKTQGNFNKKSKDDKSNDD